MLNYEALSCKSLNELRMVASCFVKKAGLDELEQLTDLFLGYLDFYRKSPERKEAKQFIKDQLENGTSEIFVAQEKEKLIGFTQLYPSYTSVGMKRLWILNDLFVEASSRKKGVATALIMAAIDKAKSTNASGLMLETEHNNDKAQLLYEKLGWKKSTDYFVYYYSL